MRSQHEGAPAGLWAITCYFNPVRYRRKLANYRLFRDHLAVPLVTVELGFDGAFDLEAGDADVLVRVSGGDVLWQKERLLNLAAGALPDSCDAVAWVDCDVIFEGPRWPEAVARALERASLVHLFHERHNLPRDARFDRLASWSAPATSISFAHKLATGAARADDMRDNDSQLVSGSTAGLAWASPRAIIDRHKLYDACILGGADRVMLASALGHFGVVRDGQWMNHQRHHHYLEWARPYREAVRGAVASIPGRLFHLWHGALRDRRYQERFRILERFDPYRDVALDAGGAWRWSSEKPELHQAVREYFAGRKEDGDDPGVEAARPTVVESVGASLVQRPFEQ
jgi:hypothetical protein